MNGKMIPMPEDFALLRFAQNNQALFDEFIELAVRGVDMASCMRLTFGEDMLSDQYAHARIWAIQRNPYYKGKFALRLKEIPSSELWNPKLAIHNLVKLALDPGAKDSARINAMKELNVITGITVVDELGQTKLGRSMDDFYSKTPGSNVNSHYKTTSGDNEPTKH